MNREEFEELKKTGGLVEDADLQTEVEEEIEDEVQETEEEIEVEPEEEELETEEVEDSDEDDLPVLSEKEKTAFEKRMERERKKAEERIRSEYEQKYGKHKSIVDLLGGDPEAIEKRIRENEISRRAQHLAEQNGWDDERTNLYIQQEKQQQELKELRVKMDINRLRDNPDYAGIGQMEREILDKIERTGGELKVEEAYWALGGSKRAEQIRLEAKVRESEKRKTKPRTVLTDSQTTTTSEKPLPADIVRDAQRMGISLSEARRLMNSEAPQNIDEYRARKAK